MNHPFFDATKFPFDRPDAQKLHKALTIAIPMTADILLKCRMAGPNPMSLAPGTPEQQWTEALDKMILAKHFQRFCEILRADESLAAIHEDVRRVVECKVVSPSEEKLRTIAANVLESEATRDFILHYNRFGSMNSRTLADRIFDDDHPMDVLFKCNHDPLDSAHEVKLHMHRLVEIVTPKCLSPEDVQVVHQYFASDEQKYLAVKTGHVLVAMSLVGGGIGIPVDIDVEAKRRTNRFAGGLITSIPTPVLNDDIVKVVFDGLLKNGHVNPHQPTLDATQAALTNLKAEGLAVCTLMDQLPDVEKLEKLEAAFPELIVMVSNGNSHEYDKRVIDQVKGLHKLFG
jgi:hypothetical protein